MVAAGADVIELGVPFSDPMADGPVIQKAGEAGAGAGHRHDAGAGHGARASASRTTTTPVVLMGYANPVERYDLAHGKDAFVRDAAAAGVDGVLVVDYPPEECEALRRRAARARHRPDLPAGADQHRRSAWRRWRAVASGYVYYVSLKGVTGAGTSTPARSEPCCRASAQHVKIPVGVGFGIRDAAHGAGGRRGGRRGRHRHAGSSS